MDAALPVVADLRQLLRRLAIAEDEQRRELARLEDRLRSFEDVERPAYESWLRLELGPVLTRLEERSAELRVQQMVAARVSELVEDEGWHPREALHLVRYGSAAAEERDGQGETPCDERDQRHERDRIEARRHAKRQRKRAERKQSRREQRSAGTVSGGGEVAGAAAVAARVRMVALYRGLARRLHPDSPTALRSLAAARVRTIWAEVQAAYAGRSLERMLALSTWLETVAETGANARAADPAGRLVSLSERYEQLRTLQRSRAALDRRLVELAVDPAWSFASAPPGNRRRLKKAAARRLEDELTQVGAALAEVEAWLASIGPPRPPRPRRGR